MARTEPTEADIQRLPKWARQHIDRLQREVDSLRGQQHDLHVQPDTDDMQRLLATASWVLRIHDAARPEAPLITLDAHHYRATMECRRSGHTYEVGPGDSGGLGSERDMAMDVHAGGRRANIAVVPMAMNRVLIMPGRNL